MKTEKITVNELFSGIGAQVSAIRRLGIPCEIKHTSDIDHNAVLAYASIHCGLTEELINTYTEYPTREEMARQLTEINLGYDFQKNKPYNWYRFVNSKSKELEKYWLANKLSRNLGDISKLEHLDYADFWTYSFPCTDISVAGKQEGIKQGQTRSGLLYEVQRLLEKANKMLVLFICIFVRYFTNSALSGNLSRNSLGTSPLCHKLFVTIISPVCNLILNSLPPYPLKGLSLIG